MTNKGRYQVVKKKYNDPYHDSKIGDFLIYDTENKNTITSCSLDNLTVDIMLAKRCDKKMAITLRDLLNQNESINSANEEADYIQ